MIKTAKFCISQKRSTNEKLIPKYINFLFLFTITSYVHFFQPVTTILPPNCFLIPIQVVLTGFSVAIPTTFHQGK